MYTVMFVNIADAGLVRGGAPLCQWELAEGRDCLVVCP